MNGVDTMPSLTLRRGWDRELLVGLFVLAGITATLVLLFSLSNPSTFQGRYEIHAVVPDAKGIRKGDPVLMRGVHVGQVRGFDLVGQQVRMNLEINRRFQVPADSSLELTGMGLLGEMGAVIKPGTAQQTLEPGSTLPSKPAEDVPGQFEQLADQAENTLSRVDSLLNDETIENVQEGTAALTETMGQLSALVEEQRTQLGALSQRLNRSATGLERITTGPELERTMEQLSAVTQRMNGVAASLERSARSAESVAQRVDRGEGSLGRLTKDEQLYQNANAAAANLSRAADELVKLTEDIRKNPKRYLNVSLF